VIIKALAYTCSVLFSTLVITWLAYCLLCTYRAVFCVGSHRFVVSLQVLETSLYRGGVVEIFIDRSIFLHWCNTHFVREPKRRNDIPVYMCVISTYHRRNDIPVYMCVISTYHHM
jgi:hypothetical protein